MQGWLWPSGKRLHLTAHALHPTRADSGAPTLDPSSLFPSLCPIACSGDSLGPQNLQI